MEMTRFGGRQHDGFSRVDEVLQRTEAFNNLRPSTIAGYSVTASFFPPQVVNKCPSILGDWIFWLCWMSALDASNLCQLAGNTRKPFSANIGIDGYASLSS